MKKNMGSLDKIIRFAIAGLIGVLYYFDIIGGTLAIISLVIASIFIVTSFMSFCPIYLPFGLSTCKVKEQ